MGIHKKRGMAGRCGAVLMALSLVAADILCGWGAQPVTAQAADAEEREYKADYAAMVWSDGDNRDADWTDGHYGQYYLRTTPDDSDTRMIYLKWDLADIIIGEEDEVSVRLCHNTGTKGKTAVIAAYPVMGNTVSEGSVQPVTDGDAKAADGNVQPAADGNAQPAADGDAQPATDGNAQLAADRNAQPAADRNVQPVTDGNVQAVAEGNSEFVLDEGDYMTWDSRPAWDSSRKIAEFTLCADDVPSDKEWAKVSFDVTDFIKVLKNTGEDIFYIVLRSETVDPGLFESIRSCRPSNPVKDQPTLVVTSPSGTGGNKVIPMPENAYPGPSIRPEAGQHPRVLFTAGDMDAIKKNMKAEEEAEAVSEFKKLKEEAFDGILPEKDGSNYDARKLGVIEAKAFDYVMYGDEENGRSAITAILNYIVTCHYQGASDNYRIIGHMIFTAAEVYDWCYPLLSQEDKEAIVAGCQKIAKDMEIGFPPGGQGAVCGHGSEAQLMRDWLALGIAVYDEFPDVYHYVAGRYLSEYVPARNYWYTSGMQHQGSAYGSYRYLWDLWAQWLMYRMSGETMYIPGAGEVMYQWIYSRRADGQLLRDGDDYNEGNMGKGYWNVLAIPLFYASNFYKDPVLKREFYREYQGGFTYSNTTLTPVQLMVFNDTDIGTESISTLPLTKYFGSPSGSMTARTGWSMGLDSPDAVAMMNIGEIWGANHDHVDAGNFQIYYKGILASESGYYETYNSPHDLNYNKESVAHNVMLIEGSEGIAGGQRRPNGNSEPGTLEEWTGTGEYEMAEVTGREYGPNTQTPEYSYLAGDLTRAYGGDVEEALRSMLFMPLDDGDHPAAFVVFDKVTTKNAGAGKTFLLHMQQEPAVDGNVSIIKNQGDGYNGMLTNQTLLPADAVIKKTGGAGREFMAGGTNYPLKAPVSKEAAVEAGWGRIEISPRIPAATDYFLNVMYVNDADQELELEEAVLIETGQVVGTKVFNRAAVFNKASERTKESIAFTVPGMEDTLKINVAGLKEGTWKITADGADLGTQAASADGGIIYFTAPAGHYELVYVSEDSNKTFEEGSSQASGDIGLMLDGNYLYMEAAPAMIDGTLYVPADAVYTGMKAQAVWDGQTGTSTASNDRITVRLVAGQDRAYINDISVELEKPVILQEGILMVPFGFITEEIGLAAEWNAAGQCITISSKVNPSGPEIPRQIPIKSSVQSGDDGNGAVIENSYDGDFTTRWAPQGKNGDAWGIYDLGKVCTLDQVYLAYHNGDQRVYYFEIAVSEDGEKYIPVIQDGASSGKTLGREAYNLCGVKARYVKYIGGGNTTNDWNSVTEIAFSGTDGTIPEPTEGESQEPTGDESQDPTGDESQDPTGDESQEPTGDDSQDPTGGESQESIGDADQEPESSKNQEMKNRKSPKTGEEDAGIKGVIGRKAAGQEYQPPQKSGAGQADNGAAAAVMAALIAGASILAVYSVIKINRRKK